MKIGEASAPDGVRIYAIGDIHGCRTQLETLYERIDEDLAANPVDRHMLVHLGDYLDRGQDCAGVVDRLIELEATPGRDDREVVFLRGNHDVGLLRFLKEPHAVAHSYFTYGGVETLRSYGVRNPSHKDVDRLWPEALEKVPKAHTDFIRRAPASFRAGDFFFCHAGVMPGVPLNAQVENDLIWIRELFLFSDEDFGGVVVHGHTVGPEPVVRENRIGIDTGAVFGGMLTAAVIEGRAVRFLQVDGEREEPYPT